MENYIRREKKTVSNTLPVQKTVLLPTTD